MFKFLNNYSHSDRRIIASGIIGNLLESYDVMICAFLAPVLALTFFPNNSSNNNLIYTFNIFFVGYMSRPIGSIIIGLFADQIGRKKTLIFSLFLVGLSTTLISVIPSYQTLGIYSSIIFLILRVIQNLSAGSEYISSIVYLTESSGKNRQGFFGSWVAVGLNSGTLLASFTVFVVIYFLEAEVIPSWSWRLTFLSAVIGMIIGLKIRYSLPESLEFILENATAPKPKKKDILKAAFRLIINYPYQCLSIFFLTWLGVCATFSIFIYSPIHMSTINSFSQYEALGINSVSLLALILLIPIFGYLSDYFEKIKMLLFSSVSFALLSIPCFWYLSYGSYTEVIVLKLLLSIPSACFFSIAPVVIVETFPLKVRCTAIALIYQIAASLAAGITPLILFSLIEYTDLPHSPGYFMVTSSVLGIAGLFILKKNPITNFKFYLVDAFAKHV